MLANTSLTYLLRSANKNRLIRKGCLFCHNRVRYFEAKDRQLSNVTRAGVDYEKEKLSYKIVVPKKFNYAADVLDVWARKERDGERTKSIPAFWHVDGNDKELKLSFEDLERQTKRAANILESRCGFSREGIVILMLPKIPEFFLISVAAIRMGVVFSPGTTMLTVKDVAYRLSSLKASYIVAHESVADVVDEAAKSSPTLKEKVIISSKPTRRKGWHDFNHLQPTSEDHKCADTNSDDNVAIFFTSGTTGMPKMVEQTQASFSFGIYESGRYFTDITSNCIIWHMTDTGWSKGVGGSIFSAWMHGACVFVHEMPRFSPTKMLEALSKYPVDTLCAAPLVYRMLLQENVSAYKFNKLEHCMSSGEAMIPVILKKWMEVTGMKIHQGYGQTETGYVLGMFKCFDYRMGSIGKPMIGFDVKIVDENENELGPGVKGEIALRRDGFAFETFKGYLNDPETSKKKLTKNYLHTGDSAYYDEEGYFWFVGRDDDVINSAGYRIGPFEIESALLEHPAVVESAAVSSPDPKRGEVVKAFVVLKPSIEGTDELVKELQDHCKQTTAPYKYPRKIEFVKDLPKTVNGKVTRAALKRKEWENWKE